MYVAAPPFHRGRLGELLIFVMVVAVFSVALSLLPIHTSSVRLARTLETAASLVFAALGVLAVRRYWKNHP